MKFDKNYYSISGIILSFLCTHRVSRLNIKVQALRHSTQHDYKKRDRSLKEESVAQDEIFPLGCVNHKQIKIIILQLRLKSEYILTNYKCYKTVKKCIYTINWCGQYFLRVCSNEIWANKDLIVSDWFNRLSTNHNLSLITNKYRDQFYASRSIEVTISMPAKHYSLACGNHNLLQPTNVSFHYSHCIDLNFAVFNLTPFCRYFCRGIFRSIWLTFMRRINAPLTSTTIVINCS